MATDFLSLVSMQCCVLADFDSGGSVWDATCLTVGIILNKVPPVGV